MAEREGCPKVGWNVACSWKMCALPDNAPMAAGVMRGDLAGGTSSKFLTASESAMADASGNNPGSGRGSLTPLSEIFTICLSCAAWIRSPRFVFHSPGMGVAMQPGASTGLSFTGLSSTWMPNGESSSLSSSSGGLRGEWRSVEWAFSFPFVDDSAGRSPGNSSWYLRSWGLYHPNPKLTLISGTILLELDV